MRGLVQVLLLLGFSVSKNYQILPTESRLGIDQFYRFKYYCFVKKIFHILHKLIEEVWSSQRSFVGVIDRFLTLFIYPKLLFSSKVGCAMCIYTAGDKKGMSKLNSSTLFWIKNDFTLLHKICTVANQTYSIYEGSLKITFAFTLTNLFRFFVLFFFALLLYLYLYQHYFKMYFQDILFCYSSISSGRIILHFSYNMCIINASGGCFRLVLKLKFLFKSKTNSWFFCKWSIFSYNVL